MNPEQARTTIVETLRQKFDDARFLYFIRNLVNHLDESKKQTWTLKKAAFEDFVNHFTRLGTYTDPDGEKLDVLVIHLRKETTLARGRVTLRNFVADYLTNGHGRDKSAVIAAFVSPNETDWRFSFVKLDHTFEKTELGLVAERALLTPARRYSYLVGVNENCHTAQRQFLELLQTDTADPTLAALEAAFGVEKVTREFFEHYRKLFEHTRDALKTFLADQPGLEIHFGERGIETDDFAKKLLGQIVFLYFLQKKGWFGVERGQSWGSGNKGFIRHLFTERAHFAHLVARKAKRDSNFFNDILEPLFYDALARPRLEEDHYYPSFDCRIPFLNGGLFEPLYGYKWEETEILLPDTLFSNAEESKEGDKGTGILDVFDRYNFTVNEAEPLEKEVAVDPEMLGKVFENLLPENIRHSSGTYYTPRVIVHYMCQQALLHYLSSHAATDVRRATSKSEKDQSLVPSAAAITQDDLALFLRLAERFADFEAKITKEHADKRLPESISQNALRLDKLLANITVCDPAIGSGAFPVGMMHEIVRARMALTPALVTLSPRGTSGERAGERDRSSERSSSPRPSPPLRGGEGDDGDRSPYALKRHAIHHSLYGVDLDPGAVEIAKLRLWLSMVVDEDEIGDIQPLPNLDYKIMQGNSLLEEFGGIRLLDDQLLQPPDASRETEIAKLKARIASLSREFVRLHGEGRKSAAAKLATEQDIKRLKKQLNALVDPAEADAQGELTQQSSWRNLLRIQELHARFFDEDSRAEKDKLRRQLDELEWNFMEATLREQGREEAIVELKRASATHRKPFFLWRLHFAEVFQQRGGFDVVIVNPPYVRHEQIKEFKPAFERAFECYTGTADLLVYFYERGVKLLRDGGAIALITSNKYYRAGYGEKLRGFLARELTLQQLIDFGDAPVFEAIAYASILTGVRVAPAEDASLLGYTWEKEMPFDRIAQIVRERGQQILQSELKPDGWRLESPATFRLMEKLRKAGKPLGEYVNGRFYRGIVTGLNEAFVVDEETKNRLVAEHASSVEVFRPYIRGRDMMRWTLAKPDCWLIFIPWHFPLHEDASIKGPSRQAERELQRQYPAVYRHLSEFKQQLLSRKKDETEIRYEWYALQRWAADYWRDFAVPKIVYPDIYEHQSFAWDADAMYLANTCYFIPTNEKWLCGVLNSTAVEWFYRMVSNQVRGGYLRAFNPYIETIPIPTVPVEQQKPVERLVERILSAKQRDAGADVSALEREIDQLVYALYGLTPEEIKLVEGSAK